MQKQAPTLGRLLVMVGFALSCFGLLLFLWLAFGGPVPLKPKGYRIDTSFPEATSLATEADVTISGVRVGKVKTLEPDRRAGRTIATVEIERRYAPLPRDTRAILRQKTLLGETYVELSPGSASAPKLVEGGRLPSAQVSSTVELDEIFRSFDDRTRAAFGVWMQTLAQGADGRGRDISDALGNLAPFAQDTDQLLTMLNSQDRAVQQLVRDTGVVFAALTEREDQLSGVIVNANTVFGTTARRDEELRALFRVLPTFQRESRTTLTRLSRFAGDTDPLVSQLRPAARELSPTLRDLSLLAPDLRAFFTDLGPLITASEKGLPATEAFLDDLRPLLGQLDPFLRSLNPFLEDLRNYREEAVSFFANTVAATQATDVPPGTDQTLHYLRTTNPINAEALAAYPRRIGTNRPNPYQFPGAFRDLDKGLPVYEDRQCGAGNPSVAPLGGLPPPLDALLPQTLLDLVNRLAIGSNEAPPCRKQGKFPSLGDPEELTDYRHVHPDARPTP